MLSVTCCVLVGDTFCLFFLFPPSPPFTRFQVDRFSREPPLAPLAVVRGDGRRVGAEPVVGGQDGAGRGVVVRVRGEDEEVHDDGVGGEVELAGGRDDHAADAARGGVGGDGELRHGHPSLVRGQAQAAVMRRAKRRHKRTAYNNINIRYSYGIHTVLI